MDLLWIFDVWVAAFGSIVGSYLNVVAHRLPRGISTIRPRSRCPTCLAPIRPWHNVPVLGWFLVRGRCRHCGRPISPRYPAVEAATGALFVLAFRRFDRPAEVLVGAAFCAAMLALALIDFDWFILPDRITLPGIVAGFALQPWLGWSSLEEALIGAFGGAAVLWSIGRVWWLWRGVEGMGFGDVKMIAMIGAFLGWKGAVVTLLIASFSGTLVGLGLLLVRRLRLGSRLPFGVFLAFGAVIALFVGDRLVGSYMEASLRWHWPSMLIDRWSSLV